MGRNRDFEKQPAQDYEKRDFLLYGIEKAKDVRSVADYVFAGINHIINPQFPEYQEQVQKAAIERIQDLLNISDYTEAEKKLLQAIAEVSKKV